MELIPSFKTAATTNSDYKICLNIGVAIVYPDLFSCMGIPNSVPSYRYFYVTSAARKNLFNVGSSSFRDINYEKRTCYPEDAFTVA